MFYRTSKGGVVVTERDQCRDCRENFLGQVQCPGAAALMTALQEGYQIDVIYCPHHREALGAKKRKEEIKR